MKKAIFILAFVFIAMIMPVFAEVNYAPNIHIKDSTSSNWAGYAVLPNSVKRSVQTVDDIKGSWIVPAVDCSSTPTSYAAFWIGIDGYSSNTVEQIGTDSDCSSGSPVYDVWYEMYPKYPVYVNMIISPGDFITAEVKFIGQGKFNLSIKDTTTGISFSTIQKSSSAKRSSGEWIAEAPWSSGVLPLADFNIVNFQNSQVTINGITGSINNPAWRYDAINMTTSSGILKAGTSALSSDGTTFSVFWSSSG